MRRQAAQSHAGRRMTRRDYSWRYGKSAANGLVRDARREQVLEDLSAAGPQAVYAGLLAYALARNYKTGWAYYAFKEIFGAEPRPQDRRVAPQLLHNLFDEDKE